MTTAGEYGPVYRIQPSDRELARRFRDRPLGPHAPDLLRLLTRLRWEPLAGKQVLFCSKRYLEWRLATLSGRRGPITVHDEPVFHDRAEAEWALFKLRWGRATDIRLDID